VARSSGEAPDPVLAASAASADNKSSDGIHGGEISSFQSKLLIKSFYMKLTTFCIL